MDERESSNAHDYRRYERLVGITITAIKSELDLPKGQSCLTGPELLLRLVVALPQLSIGTFPLLGALPLAILPQVAAAHRHSR